jgi:hypothetical protein
MARILDIEGAATVSATGELVTITVDPSGGADAYYRHEQLVAASTWTVAHNLGKRPAVTVITSAGDVVEGDIHYVNDNTVELGFGAPFAGSALFN